MNLPDPLDLADAIQRNRRCNLAAQILAGMISYGGPAASATGRHSVENDVDRALAYADVLIAKTTPRQVSARQVLAAPYGSSPT